MSEYTLSQAADILKVTKNTVKYRASKLPDSMVRKDSSGKWFLSEDGLQELQAQLQPSEPSTTQPVEQPPSTAFNYHQPPNKPISTDVQPPSTSCQSVEQPVSTTYQPPDNHLVTLLEDTIKTLQESVSALQEQLAVKDNQITALSEALQLSQESLKAAQALHAGTIQTQLPAAAPLEPNVPESSAQSLKDVRSDHEEEPQKEKRRSVWSWFRRK